MVKSLLSASLVILSALVIPSCSSIPPAEKTFIQSSHGIMTDTAWRTPVQMDVISPGRVMIALAIGQSNSANYGETRYRPKRNAYSYYRGKLYLAEDPLPGAGGEMGSVWTRLADLVVESGIYDRVVFVTAGIGATSALCWSEGECSGYLEQVLADLKENKIVLTHIFWHQGEQDNLENTGHARYTLRMEKLLEKIRKYGQSAPMYVSVASYHPHNFNRPYTNSEVRRGQADFINSRNGVLCGPDTDRLISKEARYDGVHFSTKGLELFAGMWFDAIIEGSEVAR